MNVFVILIICLGACKVRRHRPDALETCLEGEGRGHDHLRKSHVRSSELERDASTAVSKV